MPTHEHQYHPVDHHDVPMSSRAAADTQELRGQLPTELLRMIDAVALSKRLPHRMALVERVMREYVERELHDATVLLRCANINPLRSDAVGVRSDANGGQS